MWTPRGQWAFVHIIFYYQLDIHTHIYIWLYMYNILIDFFCYGHRKTRRICKYARKKNICKTYVQALCFFKLYDTASRKSFDNDAVMTWYSADLSCSCWREINLHHFYGKSVVGQCERDYNEIEKQMDWSKFNHGPLRLQQQWNHSICPWNLFASKALTRSPDTLPSSQWQSELVSKSEERRGLACNPSEVAQTPKRLSKG